MGEGHIQALQIVREVSNGFKDKPASFYAGEIELPSGLPQKIYISMNEHQRYTIMLPEDY